MLSSSSVVVPSAITAASVSRFSKLVKKIGTSPSSIADEIRQRKARKKKSSQVLKEINKYTGALGMRPISITLTYRDNADYSSKHISAFIDKCRRWAKQKGYPLPYIWALESAGRLHYHCTVWLPVSLKVDLAKLEKWWKWGTTWIQECRCIRRWGSYITKFNDPATSLPKGARLFGYGGVDSATKQKIARGSWPVWLRDAIPIGEHAKRLKGGGWVNLETGEVLFSPYVWHRGRIVLKASLVKM